MDGVSVIIDNLFKYVYFKNSITDCTLFMIKKIIILDKNTRTGTVYFSIVLILERKDRSLRGRKKD